MKIFLSVLASFVLGVVTMWFVTRQRTFNVFAHQHVASLMSHANIALHIRAGKQEKLLRIIDASLTEYVMVVDQAFRGYAASTNALWMVRAYYERNAITIPPEIKGILDSLPPKPPRVCQARLEALDKVSTTNTTLPGVQN